MNALHLTLKFERKARYYAVYIPVGKNGGLAGQGSLYFPLALWMPQEPPQELHFVQEGAVNGEGTHQPAKA